MGEEQTEDGHKKSLEVKVESGGVQAERRKLKIDNYCRIAICR